jgi:transposase
LRQWRDDGTWQRMPESLRAQVRQRVARHKHRRAGAMDSPSVKTSPGPGERGSDAGKQVQGRKRHLLVDPLGLLMAVLVTSAALSDPAGSQTLVPTLGRSLQEKAPHLGRGHLSWAIAAMGSAALSLSLAAALTSRGAKRLQGSSQALGGGTHLCLADSMPTFGQGLGSPAHQQPSLDFHCQDSFHGASAGSCLTFSNSL